MVAAPLAYKYSGKKLITMFVITMGDFVLICEYVAGYYIGTWVLQAIELVEGCRVPDMKSTRKTKGKSATCWTLAVTWFVLVNVVVMFTYCVPLRV